MKRILLIVPMCLLAADTAQDLEHGKAVFRSNCAFCHGLTGRGGRGPNLTTGRTTGDAALRAVIKSGVPGTTMPAYDTMEEDDLVKLILYIRRLAGEGAGSVKPVAGDRVKGRQVYDRNGCGACHRIGLEGGLYGPELTRVGAGRATEYIRESLVNPSADIPEEFTGVSVTTRQGLRITGLRVNEDTFTVQMRDPGGNFRMFDKSEVRGVTHESKSLMPPYDALSPEDLQNLLAYLDSLRGAQRAGAEGKKPEGIR